MFKLEIATEAKKLRNKQKVKAAAVSAAKTSVCIQSCITGKRVVDWKENVNMKICFQRFETIKGDGKTIIH